MNTGTNTALPPHLRHPLLEDLFREQAEARPDALAVIDGPVRLTYAGLRERAELLAAGLAAHGVERETVVATAFPRSADAVVCTLAVVLAGGAYLPVNPDFPGERLRLMLADGGAGLLVCAPEAVDRLAPAVPPGTRITTPEELIEAGRRAGSAPVAAPRSADRSPLAYLMFTSGSTGRPKGVMVEQSGIVRLVRDSDFYRFSPADRLLLTGALEFDASTFEIWGCLLNGATLCVTGTETLLVADALKAAVREHGITVMWMTAPLFHQTVDTDPEVFAGLGTVVAGGDVLSVRHVRALQEARPGLRIINGYGPTENTTFTTTHEIGAGEPGPFPIGRPVAGTTVLVADEDGAPVPTGEQGELLTGGTGLARGYLGNPALTAERFITVGGERYYRTGDRVSADADGLLRFHGRIDDQVKIRGHRVEVKEVEAVLLACPGVQDGCVTAVAGAHGKQLVAHVVTTPDGTAAGITAALAARLPEYLRPERLVVMDRLPLNANGKVDRAALPAGGSGGGSASAGAAAAPLDPELRPLAALWDAVLRLDGRPLAPGDDFFALGGNSLSVGALIGRLAARQRVRLTFRDIFEHRTLRAMAHAVRRRAADPSAAAAVPDGPVTAVPEGVPTVLHPQQHGLRTHAEVAPESLAYHIPLRLELRGPDLTPDRIRAALGELVRRHDALRTRFLTTGEGPRQEVSPTAAPEFTVSDLRTHPDDTAALAALLRPFDLGTAPLLRALLVPAGADIHRLYLDVHHLVFDGVSLRILAEELVELLASGAVPEAKWGYADASRWYSDRLADGGDAAHERYWRELLANPPRLELPTDRPRPPVRSEAGAVERLTLSAGHAEAVARIAAGAATTPYTVLLTAYAAALMRLSGQRDIVVGSPLSGRVHPDFDQVVGMFVGTAALRLTVDADASPAELLTVAGARREEALEHQSFPHDRVVAGLGLPRDPSRLPLIDAFFALQNAGFHQVASGNLTADAHLLHTGTCRFDLNLQAYERSGGIDLELEYSTALFDAASARYLLDRVVAAVDDLDRSPHTPLSGPVARPSAVTPAEAADFTF
ncbi:amino acid adenylation domain-containing protein [Streptomyces sp. LP05-1]|uniref:Amino acid adenylation domain-containing protein n=1 Tax=Streptomyces pyxinae TaxID=2970734 RepID=A0ABT2CEB1_9ACTN|nr:amino acid adenylation domain-containing protein [Streptomyces sp. LP05-1]MCS0635754.1 amino acid adenylation domain-containing protein [Streptomyces sp. LP05-1]